MDAGPMRANAEVNAGLMRANAEGNAGLMKANADTGRNAEGGDGTYDCVKWECFQ